MRAIGFRAFVKRKKKMLPVTDLCFNETEAVGVSGCGNAKCTLCVDWYSFDDVVLMQYTGLKDKNGKKIFEGDIVNCKFFDRMVGDIAGVINFIDCVWAVSDFKNKRLYQLIDVDNIEIIGNIHENPELLEVSE
ncbi:YopX family protein [Listeria monocytogenes]|uniref:YopX family protein n=1 Tax=Listeria monocytogenes TaxID=1639 RepID=UPI0018D1CC43|nr:YopX family protein [Listeria monocytogenes]